jgi:ribose transport system substrate-binding protein
MLRYEVGSASTEEREAGFMEVMKSEFPGIELISTDQYGGATRETAYKASQNLLNRFGARMDGIFAPTSRPRAACCSPSASRASRAR